MPPRIRACIFDVDGLLINSEDLIPIANNAVLAHYNRPALPTSLQPYLQGRPPLDAIEIILAEMKLDITPQEFREKQVKILLDLFKQTKLLPGVEKLLSNLSNIELAIATSSPTMMYHAKTGHLGMFGLIPEKHKVMGDDAGIKKGKPAPDIFLLALDRLRETTPDLQAGECLVFEDAIIGVTAAVSAGMRCVWVPHRDVKSLYFGDGKVAECPINLEDGSVQMLDSLEDFDDEKYGIVPRAA